MSVPDATGTPFEKLDWAGELVRRMGIELLELSAERAVGRVPVEGNRQPYGLLHGGASAVLAETLGSIAAAVAGAPDRFPVGIDVSVTHHRSATRGWVTGVCTPLHQGRSVATFQIDMTDDQGRRTATARLICAMRLVDASRPAFPTVDSEAPLG